jgi:TolB-like protein
VQWHEPDLAALCEGLTEEIVAGLSRFSYLRVLTKGPTGARYVLEGNLRQAGGQLRAAVKLIDTSSGANLWAENYTRPYSPDTVLRASRQPGATDRLDHRGDERCAGSQHVDDAQGPRPRDVDAV